FDSHPAHVQPRSFSSNRQSPSTSCRAPLLPTIELTSSSLFSFQSSAYVRTPPLVPATPLTFSNESIFVLLPFLGQPVWKGSSRSRHWRASSSEGVPADEQAIKALRTTSTT